MAEDNNLNLPQDVSGYDDVTEALLDLMAEYPELSGASISFGKLSADGGIAVFPVAGSGILESVRDILGTTEQTCVYPFVIVFRSGALSESRKISIRAWLDDFAFWLESRSEYPALTDNRKIRRITRTSCAVLNETNSNNTEDWAITLNLIYQNKY